MITGLADILDAVRGYSPNVMTASVTQWLDAKTGGPARRQVITVLAALLSLESADQAAVGASATQLQQGLHIDKAGIGLLLTVSSLVGTVATIPAGALVDRFNRTRMLSPAVLCWGVAMVLSSFAFDFTWLLMTRLLLGVVTALAGPAIASLMGDYFPTEERGTVWGYVLTGELAGAAIGFVLAGNLASVSWRASFAVLVPPTAFVWWLVHRLPEPARGGASRLERGSSRRALTERRERSAEIDDEDPIPFWTAVQHVLSVRTNVRLIIASALGYFFFSGLRGFAVEYAKEHYRVSQSVATSLTLVLGVGAVIGVLFGGRLADRLLRRGRWCARLEVPCGLAVLGVVFMVPAILTRQAAVAVVLLFAALVCLGGVNPPLDAARLDIMPPLLWGRAEAVRSLLRNLADAGAPLMFGVAAGALSERDGLEYTFLIGLTTVVAAAALLYRGRRSYPGDVRAAEAARAETESESPVGE